MNKIIKRDGKIVEYNPEKIKIAITKAFESTKEVNYTEEEQEIIINKVIEKIIALKKDQTIEQIQDTVEKQLLKTAPMVGKNFLVYRRERTKIRNKKQNAMIHELIAVKPGDLVNENANMATETPSGIISKIGFETSKEFAMNECLQADQKIAHELGDIHIHDLDWYLTGSLTCCASEVDVILKDGFMDSHGGARGVKRLSTAVALCAISMQKSQNLQHGAQMIPALDFYLAPYVRMSFLEHLEETIETIGTLTETEKETLRKRQVTEYIKKNTTVLGGKERAWQIAINKMVREAKQSMEGFVHDLNLLTSRAGVQVPFSSVNLGTDFSAEGRIITLALLEALEAGVGILKKTAIYPITVFKVKKGVNRLEGDPNKDLYEYSKLVASKRFYPTFVNLDATFNQHEDWDISNPNRFEEEAAIMGCRSRIFENRRGKKTTLGRGNASFTTINLPRLGILAKGDLDVFYKSLEEKVDFVLTQLEERLSYQAKVKANQVWYLTHYVSKLGKDLKREDELGDFVKHFTLGVGFIGLAETLIALTGKHHGESEESAKLGLEIITKIKDQVEKQAEKTKLNFSVFSSPGEGLAARFTKLDIKEFGLIPGVTDKEYYTNSHQIPMAYKMSMSHKIKTESPYHELTRAGHILRLEFDGDPSQNLEAVSASLELALDSNAGYIGINHNDNYCTDCGHNFKSRNTHECPKCGSESIEITTTITGYLVGSLSKWNPGKQKEFYDRIGQDPTK